MKCPVDGETLLLTSRSGVEIDYCPKCRGVWLDRGELDKLIEREDDDRDREYNERRAYDSQNRGSDSRGYDSRAYERRDNAPHPLEVIKDALGKKSSGSYNSQPYKRKKKGGLLGELFDF